MFKGALIGVVTLYVIGVVGVGGGYLARNWTDEFGFEELLGESFRVGVAWPTIVLEMMEEA
jgi:hypothetical protein